LGGLFSRRVFEISSFEIPDLYPNTKVNLLKSGSQQVLTSPNVFSKMFPIAPHFLSRMLCSQLSTFHLDKWAKMERHLKIETSTMEASKYIHIFWGGVMGHSIWVMAKK
jgi:hypothetical protein